MKKVNVIKLTSTNKKRFIPLKAILVNVVLYVFLCSSCVHVSPSVNSLISSERSVDDFMLLDQNGISHQLYYYSDQKAIVLIAHGNGCPIIRQSIVGLNKLQKQYRSRGIVFLMINASPLDDRASLIKEAADYNIQIPILEDRAQLVSESLGLTRTAEVLVIDPRQWKVIYQGPVDDHFNYEIQKKETRKHYVSDVLDQLIAGKEVTPVKIPAKGCLIGFAHDVKTQKVTYSRDVAPILEKSCLPCHSPGGVAPWSMDDYSKVKGWGRMIREVVRVGRMPPWQADGHYGTFNNDIALTPEEMRTLVHWIEGGYARGEGGDPLLRVSRPEFKEWTLGKPDLLFIFDKEKIIPPTGVIPYQIIPAHNFVEKDMWGRALDLRPGNRKAVHHCDVAVQLPDELAALGAQQQKDWSKRSGMTVDGVGQIIAGYAPGYESLFVLPEDTGLFIPKGSRLNFWMHYLTTGKEEKDMTSLGLYLYQGKPLRVYSVVQLSNKSIQIPAGEKEYRISASHVFDREVVLISLTPHMHYRGRSMRLTAEYPDGTKEILLSVPNFKFNWQRRYILKQSKIIPAGTKIIAEGVYDNSFQNSDNPDSSKVVTFGPQSDDEMFSAFIAYTTANDGN